MKYLISLLFVTIFLVPHPALAKSKMEKASDLIAIGEDYAASELIHQAILDDPTNPAVHYRAADLYIKLSMMKQYFKALNNSCKLDSSYCPKVTKRYYNLARNGLIGQMDTRSVAGYYRNAFSFAPNRKLDALDKIFLYGKKTLEAKDVNEADSSFVILKDLWPDYNKRIAKLYIENSPKVSAEDAIFLLERAIDFDSSCGSSIGNVSGKLGKDIKYTKEERQSFRKLAKKYLDKETFLGYFPPDYKIYPPRKEPYIFNLKAGETTDHWIMFAVGNNRKYTTSSADDKFELIFDDGEVVPAWTPGSWPTKTRVKFKIHAITDQKVKVFVK